MQTKEHAYFNCFEPAYFIMKFTKSTLTDILNPNRVLVVPFFQRRYVWDGENWRRFIEDIDRAFTSDQPHFMGPLILREERASINDPVPAQRIVIDGQQRLTTILLFFKCLDELHEQKSDFFKGFLLLNDGKEKRSPILKHNRIDEKVFAKIITGKEVEEGERKGSSVWDCYDYLKDKVKEKNWDFRTSQSWPDRVFFAAIDLEEKEDGQQIFDSLNSTGKQLTSTEIIKNLIFANNKKGQDLFEEKWIPVFEQDEETRDFWDELVGAKNMNRKNIDLFIFSFFLLYYHRLISDKETSEKIRKEKFKKDDLLKAGFVVSNYRRLLDKRFIKKNDPKFIEDLTKAAEIYKDKLDFNKLKAAIEPKSPVDYMNVVAFGFPVIAIVPYMLFILVEVNGEDKQNEMLCTLTNYFVRRMFAKLSASNYGGSSGFSNCILKGLKDNESLLGYLGSLYDTDDFYPLDSHSSFNLEHEIPVKDPYFRVILYLLENDLCDRYDNSDLKSFANYHLEHIMPKKWKPSHWPLLKKPIKRGKDPKEQRDEAVRQIGNLTILNAKLNNKYKNQAWNNKKTLLKKHAPNLKTLGDEFLNSPDWNERIINDRGKILFKHILSNWEQLELPQIKKD